MLIDRGHHVSYGRVAAAITVAAAFIVIVGALVVLDFERATQTANITTLPDSLWWAAVTLTSVGYGDHFPTTGGGRAAAVAMTAVGMSLLGAVTAAFAAWFTERVRGQQDDDLRGADDGGLGVARGDRGDAFELAGLSPFRPRTGGPETGPMRIVLGLFIGFWVLIFITGLANPGYVHYREHVSLLAADGNRLIWVTTLAILLTAVAQWVAARLFWIVNRPVALLLVMAGVALVVVAAFRVPCPENARHCTYTVDHTPAEAVHNAGVVVYAVLTMAAMVILGVVAVTQGRHSLVGIPGLIACGVFAMTFSGLLVFPAGLAQRVWIGIGQLWLVAASFEAEEHRERVAA